MIRFITPCMFVLMAIGFFSISKSKRHYRELVENNGEIFANQNIKVLTACCPNRFCKDYKEGI